MELVLLKIFHQKSFTDSVVQYDPNFILTLFRETLSMLDTRRKAHFSSHQRKVIPPLPLPKNIPNDIPCYQFLKSEDEIWLFFSKRRRQRDFIDYLWGPTKIYGLSWLAFGEFYGQKNYMDRICPLSIRFPIWYRDLTKAQHHKPDLWHMSTCNRIFPAFALWVQAKVGHMQDVDTLCPFSARMPIWPPVSATRWKIKSSRDSWQNSVGSHEQFLPSRDATEDALGKSAGTLECQTNGGCK